MVGLCQSGCLLDGYKLVIVCVCVCVFSQGLAQTHESNDAEKTHCLGLCYGKSVCACVCVCVFHRTGIPLKPHTFLNSQHMWWIFIAATLTSPWQPAGGGGALKTTASCLGSLNMERAMQKHTFALRREQLFALKSFDFFWAGLDFFVFGFLVLCLK